MRLGRCDPKHETVLPGVCSVCFSAPSLSDQIDLHAELAEFLYLFLI